jgi:hypothetical protein
MTNKKSEDSPCFKVLDVLLRVFLCSLEVLCGGLRISKLEFVIKTINCCSAVKFSIFWSSKHKIRIRIRIDLKCWIRVRIGTNFDPETMQER